LPMKPAMLRFACRVVVIAMGISFHRFRERATEAARLTEPIRQET